MDFTVQRKKMEPREKFLLASLLLSLISFFAVTGFFARELRLFRKSIGSYHHFVQTLAARPEALFRSLPEELANVPLAETTGLVIGSKTIAIRGDVYPYNASIVKREPEGYHLLFRYDVIDDSSPLNYRSHFGYAKLDEALNQTEEEFSPLILDARSPEDPRILRAKGQDYLIFNDLGPSNSPGRRYMHMGKIDFQKLTVKEIACFNPNMTFVEKNWIGFEHINQSGASEIYFEYSISPLQLFQVDPSRGSLITRPFPLRELKEICWPTDLWGKLRGGTPAQLVDGQYLAFFHSSFKDSKGILWYCLGAYTFEADAPFRITGISHYPILFEGIYTSPHMNTADPLKRVIFPCSFVLAKGENKELIHLSCGENDSSVKIVTLDREKLLKGLKKIKLEQIKIVESQ